MIELEPRECGCVLFYSKRTGRCTGGVYDGCEFMTGLMREIADDWFSDLSFVLAKIRMKDHWANTKALSRG